MKNDTPFLHYRPHPWHGLGVGPNPPRLVNAFIEITPFDLVKYELEKETGFMVVDRPQVTSSLPPALYGFIPRTYCGKRVASLMDEAVQGDHDPLDICVLSERSISRGDVLLTANVVGGLPTLDHQQADDKVIAVLEDDPLWGDVEDIHELPESLIIRLQHYFSTYKNRPDQPSQVHVGDPFGFQHAKQVIITAMEDYQERFID